MMNEPSDLIMCVSLQGAHLLTWFAGKHCYEDLVIAGHISCVHNVMQY